MWNAAVTFAQVRRRAVAARQLCCAILTLAALLVLAPAALASCGPGSAPFPGACPGAPSGAPCCHQCGAGHYSADGASCKMCAPGKISTGPGAASCEGACIGPLVSNSAHTMCVHCAINAVPNATHSACQACIGNSIPNNNHTACMACPLGMKPNATHTGCFPINPPKRSSPGPGLLESTPGLGSQGPSPTGTPLGGAPSGGSRGPAGIR